MTLQDQLISHLPPRPSVIFHLVFCLAFWLGIFLLRQLLFLLIEIQNMRSGRYTNSTSVKNVPSHTSATPYPD